MVLLKVGAPSPEKLGRVGGKVCSVKSLRLFIREFKEISESVSIKH